MLLSSRLCRFYVFVPLIRLGALLDLHILVSKLKREEAQYGNTNLISAMGALRTDA